MRRARINVKSHYNIPKESKELHFVIIHGAMGSPEKNWFPWLSVELAKLGHKVSVPRFPTPDCQSLAAWLNILTQEIGQLRSHHILIGHSIGSALIFRALEKADTAINAAFLVAPFADMLGLPEFDALNLTFIKDKFDWNRIRRNAPVFKVYGGDDDPYVPLSLIRNVALNLQAELVTIKNGGHLNESSGYLQFPLLLSDLKTVIA